MGEFEVYCYLKAVTTEIKKKRRLARNGEKEPVIAVGPFLADDGQQKPLRKCLKGGISVQRLEPPSGSSGSLEEKAAERRKEEREETVWSSWGCPKQKDDHLSKKREEERGRTVVEGKTNTADALSAERELEREKKRSSVHTTMAYLTRKKGGKKERIKTTSAYRRGLPRGKGDNVHHRPKGQGLKLRGRLDNERWVSKHRPHRVWEQIRRHRKIRA